MKRICVLLAVVELGTAPVGRAQDAATEERLNKLSGQIEDLIAGQNAQRKHLEALAKEIESVREQAGKPQGNYASAEDVKRLAEALKDVDRKRLEDYEKIRKEILNLGNAFKPPTPTKKKSTASEDKAGSETATVPDKGFEYVIQKGDTLSIIVQAYREKNIKVTTDQILKANPGLKPERMRVGQKIFIPAPQ